MKTGRTAIRTHAGREVKKHGTALASLALALLLSGTAASAIAERVSSYSVDRQQQDIRMRIQQGIAAGLITPDEAQELYGRERDIALREARFKHDGHASSQERDQLRRDLDAMRADVERKLANNRMAGRPEGYLPDIAEREEHIGQRIDHGIATGLITHAEAQRLRQRESDLYRREAGFRADGKITQAESEKLQRDLDALNRDVNRLLDNSRMQRH